MTDPKDPKMLLTMAAHELIYAERMRQYLKEGFDYAHDDLEIDGELAQSAIAYCWAAMDDFDNATSTWPYYGELPASLTAQRDGDADCSKPLDIRQLVIAGAYIAAEIERRQRKYASDEKAQEDAGGAN